MRMFCRSPLTTSDTGICHFHPKLMLHDLLFLYKTSTEFFRKAFHILYSMWKVHTQSGAAFFFFFSCGGGITQSAELYGGNCSRKVTGWMWEDLVLHHKQVKSSFYTQSVSVSGVMWTDVMLDIVVSWKFLFSWPDEIPETFPVWKFKQHQ